MNEQKDMPENSIAFEKLREEIKMLREDMDKTYYRIPKQEFENITVSKISNEVSEQVNKRISVWRTWAAFLLLLLSFLGISQGTKFMKQIKEGLDKDIDRKIETKLDAHIKSAGNILDEAIEKIHEQQRRLSEDQKDALERIEKVVEEKARIAAAREAEVQVKEIREDMISAQKTALKTELNALKKELENNLIEYKQALDAVMPLLEKAIKIGDKELVTAFLDEIFRWHFLDDNWEQLDELRVKYEKNYEFMPSSWANIAIADMFLYEEKFSPIYKHRAIEAYKKSLEALPYYGVPHAVRLIIHMIDYESEKDPKVKERYNDEALKLIDKINLGRVPVTSYDTYGYLLRNRDDKYVGKFIDILFELFPEPMEKMKQRYEEYENLLRGIL